MSIASLSAPSSSSAFGGSGVVFDCDGVLVNTEELGWEAWRSLAGQHGIELTLEDLRAVTGCTDEESVRYFGKWCRHSRVGSSRGRRRSGGVSQACA